MKILLIEDDPLEQLKIHTLLKEWQMEVSSVETAAEGSALFHAEQPDLVLLDWMLPDRSGLELCREFRQAPSRNPCYIIFVTGRTESREIVIGLEAGANDYISKPYRESELLAPCSSRPTDDHPPKIVVRTRPGIGGSHGTNSNIKRFAPHLCGVQKDPR